MFNRRPRYFSLRTRLAPSSFLGGLPQSPVVMFLVVHSDDMKPIGSLLSGNSSLPSYHVILVKDLVPRLQFALGTFIPQGSSISSTTDGSPAPQNLPCGPPGLAC